MDPTLTPPRYSELVEATLERTANDHPTMELRIVLRDPSSPAELLTAVFTGVTTLSVVSDASLETLCLQIVSTRADGWEAPRYWVKSTDHGRIQFGCDAFELAESVQSG